MNFDELATHFERTRDCQRAIQLAVYRTRMAVAYHLGVGRDMLADSDRVRQITGIEDASHLCAQLPALIDRIDELSALADQLWAESLRDTAKLADCRDQLATAYDGMQLQPRVYERLARQSEKPLLQRALAVRDSPADAPLRREIEQIVRLEIEDFLALEEEIAAKLRQIDAAREAVVQAHHDQIEAYVREAGRTDDVSLAAGRQGARLAAMRFDDREGFDFMDYAELWIDRELDRVGLSDVE